MKRFTSFAKVFKIQNMTKKIIIQDMKSKNGKKAVEKNCEGSAHNILLLNSNNYHQVCRLLTNKLHVRNITSLWLKREWETPPKKSVTVCLSLHLCFIWGLRHQAIIMMTMTSNGKTPSTSNDILLTHVVVPVEEEETTGTDWTKKLFTRKDCLLYRLVMHRDCLDSLMMEGNSHSFTAGFTREDSDDAPSSGMKGNRRHKKQHPCHLNTKL